MSLDVCFFASFVHLLPFVSHKNRYIFSYEKNSFVSMGVSK